MTITITVMNVLAFLLLASQVLHISGRLTVIREPKTVLQRQYVCFSEDDGAALVWNEDISKASFENSPQSKFYDVIELDVDERLVNCAMDNSDECYKFWLRQDGTTNWDLTNSFKTPLGPVFDRRWEAFQEYAIFEEGVVSVSVQNATAFSISVRAMSSDFQLLICDSAEYVRSYCYWIIIGGWSNERSVVRTCTGGVPNPGKRFMGNECKKLQSTTFHQPLSSTEWRTFLVKWNVTSRSISLYDAFNKTIFIRYQDTEYGRNKIRTQARSNNLNTDNHYHLFVRGPAPVIYRFHNYSFLHTTVEGAKLTSPVFRFSREICVQLLVVLCAECEMNIVLYDELRKMDLNSFPVNGSWNVAVHGLPTWQPVTITQSITLNDYSYMRIILIPKLISPSSNPLWAVANIRHCPDKVSLRRGILDVERLGYNGFSSSATCQKLFYDQSVVVKPLLNASQNMKVVDEECPADKIGRQCLFNCEHMKHCKGYVICYEEGCICPPGYTGQSCDSPCHGRTYGYNCKKKCGFCKEYQCNTISGMCNACSYDNDISYIPPLCQKHISKPIAPTLNVSKTDVNMKITLPMDWKNEYKGYDLFYALYIRINTNVKYNDWEIIHPNMTEVTGYFGNLTHGFPYDVAYSLRVCNQEGTCSNGIQCEWQRIETICDEADFEIERNKNSLIVDWKYDTEPQYPCPINWYHLKVQYKDEVIINDNVEKFPREVWSLPSYTLFTVTVSHNDREIYSRNVYTLEEAPSQVLQLRATNTTNTSVTLSWLPPERPHGRIVKYKVLLQVYEYTGCRVQRLSTSNDFWSIIIWPVHTNNDLQLLTITNLHPYASYDASVTAFIAQFPSLSTNTRFTIKESAIATEKFDKLKVEGWTLSWELPDCSNFTGTIYAIIKIRNISDDTWEDAITKQTSYQFISLSKVNLLGGQDYLARVYVTRRNSRIENPNAYAEIKFTTPPGSPPQVTNLEVYEVDDQKVPNIVRLRWQSPIPPLNGTLQYYRIQSYYKNQWYSTDVPVNKTCDLWDDYFCGLTQWNINGAPYIEVYAFNVNVSESGPAVVVTQTMLNNDTPDKLDDFTVHKLKGGYVKVQWRHPSRTGRPLAYFNITTVQIDTNLTDSMQSKLVRPSFFDVSVKKYMREYNKHIKLRPSTRYHISIQSVTVGNVSSLPAYKDFITPSSLGFKGQLEYVLDNFLIFLNIPLVENYTKNSRIYVIVKRLLGPDGCEGYLKVPENMRALAGIYKTHVAWVAAELTLQEKESQIFVIGDNKKYGKARNCPLVPQETYEITVIVAEENQSADFEPITLQIIVVNGEIAQVHHEAWLVPVILILVVIAIVTYFYRRKKRRLPWSIRGPAPRPRPTETEMQGKTGPYSVLNSQSTDPYSDLNTQSAPYTPSTATVPLWGPSRPYNDPNSPPSPRRPQVFESRTRIATRMDNFENNEDHELRSEQRPSNKYENAELFSDYTNIDESRNRGPFVDPDAQYEIIQQVP